MNILLVNFLFYFVTFYKARKRYNTFFNQYVFIMMVFSLISFLGYYTFQSGIYEDTFGSKNIDKLSIVPYILGFIFIYSVCVPLKKINLDYIRIINIPQDKSLYSILYMCLLNYFFNLGLGLIALRSLTALDYAEVYISSASGELQTTTGSYLLDNIYGKSLLLVRILTPVYNIIALYLWIKTDKLKPLFLLIIGFVLQIPQLVITANRGGMFFLVINMFFYFILFYDYISKRAKRCLFIVLIAGVLFIMFYSIAITYARMGDGSDGINQIFRYFGEPFPNLGFNIWGYDIQHPYGARYFPSLTETLGMKTLSAGIKGRNVAFEYWESFVGIPMLNFKTLFGDLYVEFGVFGSFVFLFIYFTGVKALLNYKRHTLISLSLLFLPYKFAVYSIFGGFLGERDVLDLIAQLGVVYFFNFYIRKISKNNTKTYCFNLQKQ